MEDEDFEGDDAKAAQNLASHGVMRQLSWPSMTLLPWCARTGVKITARIAIYCSAWSSTAYLPSHTRSAARECGLFRPDWRNHGNDDATMKRTAKGKPKIEW